MEYCHGSMQLRFTTYGYATPLRQARQRCNVGFVPKPSRFIREASRLTSKPSGLIPEACRFVREACRLTRKGWRMNRQGRRTAPSPPRHPRRSDHGDPGVINACHSERAATGAAGSISTSGAPSSACGGADAARPSPEPHRTARDQNSSSPRAFISSSMEATSSGERNFVRRSSMDGAPLRRNKMSPRR